MTPAMILHKLGLAEHPDRAPQKRSPKWRSERAKHLDLHPECAVCGTRKNVEVHHIIPFNVAIDMGKPELELDPENLITLCDGPGISHHLLCGHLESYRSWNPNVIEDVRELREKIRNRP